MRSRERRAGSHFTRPAALAREPEFSSSILIAYEPVPADSTTSASATTDQQPTVAAVGFARAHVGAIGRVAVVLASAVAYGWCFPPQAIRGLAWIALVPLLVIVRSAPARVAAVLTWLWTVAMAYTVNDWFPRMVSGYFMQPALVGFALFLGVSTCTAAVQYVGFTFAYRRLVRRGPIVGSCLAAAAWVGADLARMRMFGGDPWALLGYSQVGLPALVQVADLTGVYGVTFGLVLMNAAVAELWCAVRRRGAPARAVGAMAVAASVVIATLFYGMFRLQEASSATRVPAVVAIVQENLPLGSQWRADLYGRNLDAYLRSTASVLRSSAPALVVWPENAMTFFLADEPTYRLAIAAILGAAGPQLIAGGPYAVGDPPQYSNSAFLVSPKGEIEGRYDKRELLPFAEFFPFGGIDLLRRNFGRVREFTPGTARPLFETALGPTGVITCNEGFSPEPAADRVRAGATVLVNLSNDSWLNDPKYSEPAFDMVILRAVEQRRWIIRASTAGPSGFIDPWGRVVAHTKLFAEDTVAASVESRDSVTMYCLLGDAFAWTCLAVAFVACLLPPFQGTRSRFRNDRVA